MAITAWRHVRMHIAGIGAGLSVAAPTQIKDDGPQEEMCHEEDYRCSRTGRPDFDPDIQRGCECGAGVPGELVIRLERLLIEDKLRSGSPIFRSDLSCEAAGLAPAALA
jgi:hypothetical protein